MQTRVKFKKLLFPLLLWKKNYQRLRRMFDSLLSYARLIRFNDDKRKRINKVKL